MPKTFTVKHESLGPAVRYLRQRSRMSQEDLRNKVSELGGHLGQAWLSRIERGKAAPSEKMLDHLLAATDSNRQELGLLLSKSSEQLDSEARQGSQVSLLAWAGGQSAPHSRLHQRSFAPTPAPAGFAGQHTNLIAGLGDHFSAGHNSLLASEGPTYAEGLTRHLDEPDLSAPSLAEAVSEFMSAYEDLDDQGRKRLIKAIRNQVS